MLATNPNNADTQILDFVVFVVFCSFPRLLQQLIKYRKKQYRMVAFQIFPFWTMDMDWVYYMEDVSEWAGDVMKAKKKPVASKDYLYQEPSELWS